MPLPTMRRTSLSMLAVLLATPAQAQATGDLALRSLAATCAACHGAEGRAVAGAGMASLRGLDRAYLHSQLIAFRDGTRPATVMHQIARGYTPEQLEQLAAYFADTPAALPRVAP
jgi:sulfide dehydrogenase cytochrome subunit